jgi:hypothetical protein
MNNFIEPFQFEDTSICDDLIAYHKNGKQLKGTVGYEYKPEIKQSTDVILEPGEELNKYCMQLQKAVENYIVKYKWCNNDLPWNIQEKINLQHYNPNEGFFQWHTERTNLDEPTVSRHLVFMTYLNDVTDGGETEWLYQEVKFQPKKGLTLIWPVDWTFIHRGITSKTQEKYIATGWFSYVRSV